MRLSPSFRVSLFLSLLPLVACERLDSPVGVESLPLPNQHATMPDGSPVALTGLGTAVVDGVIGAGEWDDAGMITFSANLPASEGGGTTVVQLLAMNDGVTVYLALVLPAGLHVSSAFEFDNDHDGQTDEGDDVLVANALLTSPIAQVADVYRTFLPPCPEGALCGLLDVDGGGTSDAAAAYTTGPMATILEIAHPLDTDDDAHDFSLAPGDIVGFGVFLSLIAPCGEWPDCFGDTSFPQLGLTPSQFGDLIIASPVLSVGVDVRPGESPNPINIGSRGVVPVAILGSEELEASQIDVLSVRFGPGSAAPSGAGLFEDVNGDGVVDLLLRFSAQASGFSAGDAEGCIVGETVSGEAVAGCDAVVVVPPSS
jgi:hypothetical protein